MDKLILVAVGGGAGAVVRHAATEAMMKAFGYGWPAGTLVVNVLGGLLMGGLTGWIASRGDGDVERWRLLLGVGVLGGFTTFSAFSLEALLMLERREWAAAFTYVLASVILSVTAVFVGLVLVRRLAA